MPLDAPTPAADTAPPIGTAGSFRLLTARLKRLTLADLPGPAAEALPVPPSVAAEPPPEPGAAVEALLDIIWGAVGMPPQERSMAGDVVLMLLPRLSRRELAVLAERVAALDQPPPLLVSRLANDPRPEIGGVLLERIGHMDTADLLAACEGDAEKLRLVARRRHVPPAVSERLVEAGDLLSLLALLRNPGAEIPFNAYLRLSQMAAEHPGLQAPLALRTDLPLAVALDLLWRLPPELRRIILARFLTDSVTLGRILSLAQSSAGAQASPAQVEAALAPLLAGATAEAARQLAEVAGVDPLTVERIFSDAQGEALVVLLKALGIGRSRFDTLLDRLRATTALLREDRPPEELKAVFDGLSFTKARVLLTYWDWFTRRAGPYASVVAPGLVEAQPLA